MNWGISALLGFWLFYSAITCFGIVKFPAYDTKQKFTQILLVLALPIVGALIANRNLGLKFDDAVYAEAAYQLPFWASFMLKDNNGAPSDDFDL